MFTAYFGHCDYWMRMQYSRIFHFQAHHKERSRGLCQDTLQIATYCAGSSRWCQPQWSGEGCGKALQWSQISLWRSNPCSWTMQIHRSVIHIHMFLEWDVTWEGLGFLVITFFLS